MGHCYATNQTVVHGRRVRVDFTHDEYMGAPWKEHDGHGVVRQSKNAHSHYGEKEPHERPLNRPASHEWQYYYDVQGSIKRALEEGWGYIEINDWMRLLGQRRKNPTKRMIAALAVEEDFQHLRAWCNDEWHWCSVSVMDVETGIEQSMGGIESNSDQSYFDEVISDLADEMWPYVCKALLSGKRGRKSMGVT
jgi:hypothetical protein